MEETMQKVFLDCGTNHFLGLKKMVVQSGVGLNWKIHTFEPNPEARSDLEAKTEDLRRKGFDLTYHPVAVGDFDGMVSFKYSNEEDKWGTTCSWHTDHLYHKEVQVPQIDLAAFIRTHCVREDRIVCKMDIEGAEFHVLDHLLKTGMFEWFDELFVEWHVDNQWGHDWPAHFTEEQRTYYAQLKEQICNHPDVRVHEWD